ncbi:RnfABCDGE type electron transport complex subunit D [Intestinimonas butyriciproducens]|uniref:RnfABCDGE type electron transport complex subunit D n=1 Tax=Intestinimonas butyriciproducens TaxID=1297617 RepID=UPI001958144C|nr:RnfABCDGE type electron transport complex subunit D [Intestinimonas butyriciproducens]MBM6918150.1 RnfABCDGE type electron transport complex subunit D [Intestinimonas butyriciproducens]
MADLSKLTVSSSPHIRHEDNTRQIMVDVIIALMPALAIAIYVFGPRALTLTAVSAAGCLFFEWLYQRLMKKPVTVGDCSALVTGILLAYCLPVSSPMWMVLIGDAFAIIVVKQLYGGIGKNFMNPALSARAFLMSFPVIMTTWPAIRTKLPLFATPDVVSSATPLASLKQGLMPNASLTDLALGMVGGSMGEISALALLAGGLYLISRKVITFHTPVAYLGTVALLCFLFPHGNGRVEFMLAELCSGGLMLGAIFMATDYSTSPVTKKGQVVFGIGCGLLTVFIRFFGNMPEGVSYSILVMNATVFLIEKVTRPRKYGFVAPPKAVKTPEGGKSK